MARLARDRFIFGVTLAYVAGATLWIFLSDRLITSFADISELSWFATAKGFFFVLVTAALLAMALRRVPAKEGGQPAPVLDSLIAKLPFHASWLAQVRWPFAVFSILLVLVVSLVLPPGFVDQPVYTLMLLPVILSAAIGGGSAGLLATALAALGCDLLLIEPRFSLRIAEPSRLIKWSLFIADGLLVSLVCEALRRIRTRQSANQLLQGVVLSSITDAVVAADQAGRILFVNREAEGLSGCSARQAEGRLLSEVFAIAEDEVERGTFWLTARDGRRIPVQHSIAPIRSGEDVIGQVLLIRDESELREARQQQRLSQTRFERLIKQAPMALCFVDGEGNLRYGNDRFLALFGYSPSEVPTLAEWWPRAYPDPGYRADITEQWNQAVEEARRSKSATAPIEARVRCADGEERQVELVAIPVDGGLLTSFYDLTVRRRAEQALRETRDQLARAIEASGVAFWEWWPDSDRIRISDSFATMLGHPPGQLDSLIRQGGKALLFSDGSDEAQRQVMRHFSGELPGFEFETRQRLRDGGQCWVLVRGRVSERDEEGKPRRVSGTLLDVTEHHLAAERIAELAFTDSLTGLPNRLLLKDRVEQAINHSRRKQTPFVLAFLDLDVFKKVNDSLGHTAGDCLLKGVAERLRGFVRAEDTVARLGGDEFVVLLSDTGAESAIRLLPKLLEDIASPYPIEGHSLTASASIGVCEFPTDGSDYDMLVRAADAAMYEAKAAGRNTFRFYRPEMNEAAVSRLELEEALRHAIAHGELELRYPAQRDLVSGALTGYEAQLHWHNPLLGEVPPESFIPLAEATGLIHEIGRWVLREACRQNQTWIDQGISRVPVAINLSMMQVKRGEVGHDVAAALAETGMPPSLLELEITEAQLASANERILRQLNALKELGVRLVIDDFGAGYSNITDLKRFPVDRIKICPSFVRDLTGNRGNRDIAAAIVGAATALDLDVVAEGVESPEQARELVALGCRVGQEGRRKRASEGGGLST